MANVALIFAGLGSLAECADIDRQAWNATFRAVGLRWDWSWDSYAELMRHGGDRIPAERYAEFIEADVSGLPLIETHQRSFAARMNHDLLLRPGVLDVLKWAARSGVRLGFVSRCAPGLVHPVLAATARARGGIEFDTVITQSEAPRPAPHPDALELACDGLGVQAAVAISDTPAGAAAALDAGMATIAFPGILAEELMFPEGVLETRKLDVEAVARLFGGAARTAAE